MENSSKLELYHDIQRSVIGSALASPECLTIFCTLIRSENLFSLPELRVIAKAIFELHEQNQPNDLVSLLSYLKSKNLTDKAGGRSEVSKLYVSGSSNLAKFEQHIRLLQEAWFSGRLKAIGTQLATNELSDTKDPFEVASRFVGAVEDALNLIVVGEEPDFEDILEEHSQNWGKPGVKISGTSTGFDSLDTFMGGLVNGNLIILAARPGQGKTAFVLSILRRMANQGQAVGMFSLEMGRMELMDRLVSIESQVYATKIKRNNLTEIDLQRMVEAKGKMRKWKFKVSDSASLNIRTLKAKAMLWKKKHDIKVLVVDYLQLMSGSGKRGQNREQEISEISRGLKILAKDLDIPVIALSQLSRAVESRPSKQPQLSDLRESGAIEQDANIVIFLMRPGYYGITDPIEYNGKKYDPNGLCLVDIAKFRDGDPVAFPMIFKAENTEFTDHPDFIKKPESGFAAKTPGSLLTQFENPQF